MLHSAPLPTAAILGVSGHFRRRGQEIPNRGRQPPAVCFTTEPREALREFPKITQKNI
jgi:hypothetical protein